MRFLSLFSGIEAASAAWLPLGWECVGVSEIENFPCAVLKHHHPHVPNLGDITKITEAQIMMLGRVDLVVFGSPCQDLSVAGKQKGLAGERSGLFHDAIRIVRWARIWGGCRFALWENVPGAFTSSSGRDFAAVVDALAGLEPGTTEVPPKKWGNEGCAVGPEAMVEWGTLDAQWFGVAQRRRRVFALADFGNWADRPPILLESQSVRGDSAPRRGSQEDAAPTLAGGSRSRGGFSYDDIPLAAEQRPVLISSGNAEGSGGLPFLPVSNLSKTVNNQTPLLAVCATGQVTHALNTANNGKGSSEDGTGRGVPTIAFQTRGTNLHVDEHIFGTLGTNADRAGGSAPCIAFDSRQECVSSTDVFGALSASSPQAQAVAFQSSQSGVRLDDSHATLDSNNGSRRCNGVLLNMRVRRLTPLECERLQAFRDGHTAIKQGSGKPAADGPRYKALGNSMAVVVMRWIGLQLDFAWRFF